MGIPTEEKWAEIPEEYQLLGLGYEQIREAEEADEVGNLMQASSLGSMKKKM